VTPDWRWTFDLEFYIYINCEHYPDRNYDLKYSEASMISSFMRALLSLRRIFVELNIRSHLELIAGIDSISKAIRANEGY